MSKLDDNLSLVHQFVGWGDPAAGLWIVGLEEGEVFDQEDVARLRRMRAAAGGSDSDRTRAFWNRPRPVEETGWKPYLTDWGVGRLCAALEGVNSEPDVAQYVRGQKWAHATFNTNLYALAHQRSRGRLPGAYVELFGVQHSAESRVQKCVNTRHETLRSMWAAGSRRPVLVCLGLGNQSEFESVFSLDEAKEIRSGKHRFLVYKTQRALVVPHASRGPFHRCIPDIVAVLKSETFRVNL